MIEFTIGSNEEQQRLDRFLKKYLPNAPLSYIYKIVRKDVKVNGKRIKPESILCNGDVVQLYMKEEDVKGYGKKEKPPMAGKEFDIAYEDENMIIVNKPKGLLTHGDKEEKKNTLVNQVIGYLVDKGDYVFSRNNTFIPAPVNRLDRNTSGLVIFGKNNLALQGLNKMIKEKENIEKYYLAIAFGELKKEKKLTSVMVKDEENNKVSIGADGEGKVMTTIIKPLKVKNGYSLIQAQLITGRTHQIRVHLAEEKLYILGDIKYGSRKGNQFAKEKFGLQSQFLHAYMLKFNHCAEPFSYMNGKEVKAPLPKELEAMKNSMFDSL